MSLLKPEFFELFKLKKFFSSIIFNKTGTTVKANNKEEETAKIIVIAISPTNSGLAPFPAAIGINARPVVTVAASKGKDKCLIEAYIASRLIKFLLFLNL